MCKARHKLPLEGLQIPDLRPWGASGGAGFAVTRLQHPQGPKLGGRRSEARQGQSPKLLASESIGASGLQQFGAHALGDRVEIVDTILNHSFPVDDPQQMLFNLAVRPEIG